MQVEILHQAFLLGTPGQILTARIFFMTYAEKLKSPKWQKLRLKILERDKWTCQSCFDTESTLNVHHKSYIFNNEIWDYPDDNFQTLCETCHASLTEYKREIKAIIDYWPGLKELKLLYSILSELQCRTPIYHKHIDWYVQNKMDKDVVKIEAKKKKNV